MKIEFLIAYYQVYMITKESLINTIERELEFQNYVQVDMNKFTKIKIKERSEKCYHQIEKSKTIISHSLTRTEYKQIYIKFGKMLHEREEYTSSYVTYNK